MDMADISEKLRRVLSDLETITTMFENIHANQKTPTNDDFLTRNSMPRILEE